ncbi:glycosyltransferase [Nocardioides flavescens]|uniref:Glycosyltransferase n=1 Tax=Nocardioides flavescens TaxID=2691959 RepID=A0A6L7F033_9ACTN|nr:glycosyltransferase [Nocardioides flavescens]
MNTLVIVPTYQEAGGVVRVLDAVLAAAPEVDVLVVDDASPDGTGDLVAAHPAYGDRVRLLRRPGRSGLGSAYRDGFAWALARSYEAVVEMDADLSHPPDELPRLVAALADADLVIGSRYVPGGRTEGWPWRRAVLSRLGNAYVRGVLGLDVHDATGGYRAFRATTLRAIRVLSAESDGYAFQVETTWRADRHDLRIVEVPITFTDRTVGRSKMTAGIAAEALVRVARWRLGELTGRGPRASARSLVGG